MGAIDIVKQGIQAWSTGDVAAMDSLITDDFIFSGPTPQPLSKAEFLGLCQANHTAFPDFSFNASDFHEDGDTVTCNTFVTGTHLGPLAMIPGVPVVQPTGKRIQILPEPHTYTLRGDKIARLSIATPPGGGIPQAYAQLGSPLPTP